MPSPYGVLSVSPSTTFMSLDGIPSWSATIWANVVACPWPCDFTPSLRIALPVGCTRSSAESIILSPRMSYFFDGPAPTASVKCAMPMPMSRPSARACRCSSRSAS